MTTQTATNDKWVPGTGKALHKRIREILANVPYGQRMTFNMALAQAKQELGVA